MEHLSPDFEQTLDLPAADQKRNRKGKVLGLVAGAAVAAVVLTSIISFENDRTYAIGQSGIRYDKAVHTFQKDRVQVYGAVAVANATADSAVKTLDASKGKTLDETARKALADLIAKTRQQAATANYDANKASDKLAGLIPDTSANWTAEKHFKESAKKIGKLDLSSVDALGGVQASLTKAVADVNAAVDAWNAEQARIAAEKAAAEAAARAAAEAAAAAAAAQQSSYSAPRSSGGGGGSSSGGSSSGGGGGGGGGVNHDEGVWAYGFQAEIDACNGSVNVTARYGTTAIAEHWSCGGRNFPTWGGATVRVHGAGLDGIYRVEGIVARLNVNTNTTADIPHGYDLIYQTCWNGNSSDMTLIGMTRIG